MLFYGCQPHPLPIEGTLVPESIEVNHIADLTACKASSILGKGKEPRIVMAFRAWKSIHKHISPVFLQTITTCDTYGL